MEADFFRHFRPHWFNQHRMTIDPQVNGGISFLLSPIAEKTYDYWVYICPLDAPFSAKAASKRLREVKAAGVIPWGSIYMSGAPVIDLLIESAGSSQSLPTELYYTLKKIANQNRLAEFHKTTLEEIQQLTRKAYAAS